MNGWAVCREMIRILAAALLVSALMAAEDRKIGVVDFYGYSGLDLDHLRATLPFHEGDPLPSRQQLAAARESFAKAIGRNRVEFALTCCMANGRSILDVGIEESDAPVLRINPRPNRDVRLPRDVVQLYEDHGRETSNGIRQGVSGEDESHGYTLSDYGPARAVELQIREYARGHISELITVLRSSASDSHRAVAAEAIGYASESPQQVAALVHASFDSNSEVRNNAIRALSTLVEFDPKILPQIPLDGYVALLHSIEFFDRNKACFVIDSFTQSRDPKVLGVLRKKALTPLLEMAQWQDKGHAACAFEAVARIAGLPENRIDELRVDLDVKPILEALRRH